MGLKHFSHKHPLTLTETKDLFYQKKETKDLQLEEKYKCYGCLELITSQDSKAYSCTQYQCEGKFFLHKSCAELPREISHPEHQQHSLFLHQRPVYVDDSRSCGCNVCHRLWSGFTYNCSLCEFDVDIMCVLRDKTLLSIIPSPNLNHKSHEHPLIFEPRTAIFFCNACGTMDEEQSYSCSKESCPFWIHKSCALLPEIIESNHHNHPLSLAYSFPSEYGHLGLKCDFCHKKFYWGYWVYHCLRCRYFVHAKCTDASKETAQAETVSNLGFSEEDKSTVKLPGNDMFAVSNIFELLIRDGYKKYGLAQELFSEIKHFSHVHPLVFSIGHQHDVKEMKYEEAMICDGCIMPICDSYYSCENCNYFLHASCAQLPKEFQHPSHPEHPLVLRKLRRSFSYLPCEFCKLNCNGFLYTCEVCQFRLDLKCAILNTVSVLMHEAHPHQLHNTCSSDVECNGCNRQVKKNDPAFGCENCSFYLHYKCTLLPRYIFHFDSFRVYKRDNHPLTLMYPPFSEHPEEFYCEICEEEIHPKYWLYHCSDCDESFHSYCIVELDKYRNIKFGVALQVINHTHAVKFIIRGAFTPFCACCDGDLYCAMAFECGDCDYYLCYLCGINSLVDIGDEDSNSFFEDESKAHNSIKLPMSDNSELIRHFLKQHGIVVSQLSAEIKHFSHDHPLNLSINHSEDVKALENEEILICDGCIRPISDPYYSCKKCNYFLHAYCAQLPDEIQQPLHSQHSLVLSKLHGYRHCKFCTSLCNGFLFKCKENCDFHLDVHCAILTSSNFIEHETHCHQLLPTKVSRDCLCNGCHKKIKYYSGGALSCVDCNFHLDYNCAILPRFVKHIKDEHSLVLSCHSASHRGKVIYCENCKEKIYTIYWFYYCSECNRSFHPHCISELGFRLQNMKFGGIVQVQNHSHALMFVWKDDLFYCNHCGFPWVQDVAYECEPCGYCICMDCADKNRNVEEAPPAIDNVGSSST